MEAEKSVTEIFVGEKKKWTNTGTDKQYIADSLLHSTTCHTQCLYQFHNPKSSSSREIFDEKNKFTDRQT